MGYIFFRIFEAVPQLFNSIRFHYITNLCEIVLWQYKFIALIQYLYNILEILKDSLIKNHLQWENGLGPPS